MKIEKLNVLMESLEKNIKNNMSSICVGGKIFSIPENTRVISSSTNMGFITSIFDADKKENSFVTSISTRLEGDKITKYTFMGYINGELDLKKIWVGYEFNDDFIVIRGLEEYPLMILDFEGLAITATDSKHNPLAGTYSCETIESMYNLFLILVA